MKNMGFETITFMSSKEFSPIVSKILRKNNFSQACALSGIQIFFFPRSKHNSLLYDFSSQCL